VGRQVLVVSASMGAGHDAPARELVRRLEQRGDQTRIVDLLACLPLQTGRLIRGFYSGMLRHAPWLYDAIYDRILDIPPDRHATVSPDPVVRAALPRLRGIVADLRPDSVVVTWHVAAQAIGRLRDTGVLAAPVTVLVTEIAVHRAWVHPSNDRHICVHAAAAQEAADRGAQDPVAADPVIAEAFRDPALSAGGDGAALPGDVAARLAGRVPVLIAAGAWGAGAVVDTARAITADPSYAAVVLCGRNRVLADRLRTTPGVVALGWRDDVPQLLAGSAAVVQNGGGLACWEALALRRPVVTYLPLPGHGRAAAARLEALALAPWPRDQAALQRTLAEVVDKPPPPAPGPGVDAADLVLG
jgi:UDP-N-acetylglucosamine:LPS N-acetylglucosamine transferase